MEQSEVIPLFRNGKFVEDARSIASETSCPGTIFSDNYQKDLLLPSAVKFVE